MLKLKNLKKTQRKEIIILKVNMFQLKKKIKKWKMKINKMILIQKLRKKKNQKKKVINQN